MRTGARSGLSILAQSFFLGLALVSAAGAQSLHVTHVAGTTGGGGYADGKGPAARFNRPLGAAVDPSGNMYVSDGSNHLIRKITPDGVVTTVAGQAGKNGNTDGPGDQALFAFVQGMVSDSSGNIYVADSVNNTIRKVTPDGVVSTLAGTGVNGSVDGPAAQAQFAFPCAIAIDSAGNLYVGDADLLDDFVTAVNNKIRKITPDGTVTTLAGSATGGSADGTGAAAQFNLESSGALAVDSSGNVYVADSGNNTIRKVTQAGVVTTIAGTAGNYGSDDGVGPAASFAYPDGISMGSDGNLYVSDGGSNVIRKVTPDGVVTTYAGVPNQTGFIDGVGSAARLNGPVLTASNGTTLYIPEVTNNAVRTMVIATAQVTTLAGGSPIEQGTTDAPGSAARFVNPTGVATDGTNLYVSDANFNIPTSMIRRIALATGAVTTLAGSPGVLGSSDGTGPSAQFNLPRGVATDGTSVYVADTANATIRQISIASGAVTTLAGTAGNRGSQDGGGANARFTQPWGLAVQGNILYVTEVGNSTIRRISDGVVTTLAGAAGQIGSADGVGTAARFSAPRGITSDGTSLYVADTGNFTIRRIDPVSGTVTTIAGTPGIQGLTDGVGSAALFNNPVALATDGSTLYIVDGPSVRTMNIATGEVLTRAGTIGWQGGQDGPGPGPRFFVPGGIAYANNATYVADGFNAAVRQAVCGADSPINLTVSPMGNPSGPVTGVDYLDLSWAAQFAGLNPNSFEWAINGDPFTSAGLSTSATAPPRNDNDPITLHVRARACNPEVVGTASDSQVYSPAPPVASFTITGSGTTFTFTDTSTPQATSWLWLFGDGQLDTTQSVTHTYSSPGTYSIVLIATNGAGSNSATKQQRIETAGVGVAGALAATSFDATDPLRQTLASVQLAGAQLHVIPNAAAKDSTIVYLRILDDSGRLAKERRLSVAPGQEAVYDLGAYGIPGIWNLELVSTSRFDSFVAERRERTRIVERTPR
jgi:PKD repeat protein/sugar lactone lactonase YvrE